MVQNQIQMLIESDCIIDLDIGILKLVQFDYRNTNIWLDNILDNLELELQQYLMTTRIHENPLSIILKEDYWDSLDILYNDFLAQDINRIIDLSCNTNMMDIVRNICFEDTPINATILYNYEHEVEVIKRRLGTNAERIIFLPMQNADTIDSGQYTSIFVKYISALDKYKKLSRRNIYIADHELNMIEDSGALIPDALKYMTDNIINIYSLYQFDFDEIAG